MILSPHRATSLRFAWRLRLIVCTLYKRRPASGTGWISSIDWVRIFLPILIRKRRTVLYKQSGISNHLRHKDVTTAER
ncbi:MAG TPA: hypothetical protein DDY14_07000 [Chromatiaceae bacterium]|jgi:hypothetical protein|nr:MAG: hypothetical protein N838_04035 [Thiohalocapsa sp. PB-PSB1]HBG95062.1 hypothetical protein [Chromatiaceae bacterium]HCS90753.1 hypothetical protein [Chromatiaceae bacterium]